MSFTAGVIVGLIGGIFLCLLFLTMSSFSETDE
jgi:hypothetical protein